MEQSIHESRRGHSTHSTHSSHRTHRKHRSRFRIKWFDRFRRFDEYGFINPEYDKINLFMGKLTGVLILIAFIVLLVMCINESHPSQVVY